MTVPAALTRASIRHALKLLNDELFDDAIPYKDTAARVVVMADTVAQFIVAKVGQLPDAPAHLLANAVRATQRRDLLAALEFISEALSSVPARAKPRP